MTHEFNDYMIERHKAGDFAPNAAYAVSSPDHYLPLLYCLGAAGNDEIEIFNNGCNLGSMAMTGFVWKA